MIHKLILFYLILLAILTIVYIFIYSEYRISENNSKRQKKFKYILYAILINMFLISQTILITASMIVILN